MHLVIGPVLRQANGYAFDSWRPNEGSRRSYAYGRIEDAYRALKSAAAEAASDSQRAPVICSTSDEFASMIEAPPGDDVSP
jgi:hypothetical protein